MQHKHEHLEASLERALREVFARGFNDPRISGILTITGVRVTPDHTQAFVSVSILPEDKSTLSMHGLESAARHIRREVGERIRTRQMPQITFQLDSSLKRQARVLEALDRARGAGTDDGAGKGTWGSRNPDPHQPTPGAPGANDQTG